MSQPLVFVHTRSTDKTGGCFMSERRKVPVHPGRWRIPHPFRGGLRSSWKSVRRSSWSTLLPACSRECCCAQIDPLHDRPQRCPRCLRRQRCIERQMGLRLSHTRKCKIRLWTNKQETLMVITLNTYLGKKRTSTRLYVFASIEIWG